MNNRPVAFVVLDAFGKYTHMADANRLKKWLEAAQLHQDFTGSSAKL